MQNQPRPARTPSNPTHRRQVFWQVWAPLAAAALIVLAAAVLAVIFSGSGQVNSGQLASVAIIWMLLPLILAGILFMIFTAGMIFLLSRALRILPTYTHLILLYAQILNLRVTQFLDTLVNPVIRGRGSAAGLKVIFRRPRRA